MATYNIIPNIPVKSRGRTFPAGRPVVVLDTQFQAWVDIYGRENFTEINTSPKQLLAEKLKVMDASEEPAEQKIIIPPTPKKKK